MNYFYVCLYWLLCVVIFMVIFMNDVLFNMPFMKIASAITEGNDGACMDVFTCDLNSFLCKIFKGTAEEMVS